MQIFLAGRVAWGAWERKIFPNYYHRLVSFPYSHDLPAYVRTLKDEYYVEPPRIKKEKAGDKH